MQVINFADYKAKATDPAAETELTKTVETHAARRDAAAAERKRINAGILAKLKRKGA